MNSLEILNRIGECFHSFSSAYGLIASLFLAGFLGGFSHCVAMCGPFVLSQSGNLEKFSRIGLFPYHLGRITTYVFLAFLFSGLLNLAVLFLPERLLIVVPLLVLSGLIFLVNAFPQLATIFPWASSIKISLPYRWIVAATSRPLSSNPLLSRYLVGVVLGFMPCGLVVAALMAAASAASGWQGALAMAAFGVGTMPALLLTALAGRRLMLKFPALSEKLTKGFMAVSAVWLFAWAGLILL
jgi:sulfite exporter TauE/SafE